MNKPNMLFELNVVTDNPLFEGFALEEEPSLLGKDSLDDDITPRFDIPDDEYHWEQPRLANKWTPPKVSGRVAPFNDFPGIDMMLPAFSRRAVDALRDLLEPNGELLRLSTDTGEFFFYNVTTIVDALDAENSECDWNDPPSTAVSIDHFEFHEAKLRGLSVFRLYQWPMGMVVSDVFVSRVCENGLNGFEFVKIWPYERGVHWRAVRPRELGQRSRVKDLKRHSLVLIFLLAGKKPKASEKRRITELENELDAQLAVSSLRAPFFGWYEGSDSVDGEYRMFLSCPDVDSLEQKLKPWLENLSWSGKAFAVKRYGNMHDADAEEAVVEVVE